MTAAARGNCTGLLAHGSQGCLQQRRAEDTLHCDTVDNTPQLFLCMRRAVNARSISWQEIIVHVASELQRSSVARAAS
jgi:hypothetical protein